MTTPSPSDPVALELALALRATREALDERDAELEASRAKRAELVTELEATKTTLEATNTTLEALQALHPTKIDGNVACAIFSHLKEPKDRDALASWLEKASELGHVGATHDLAVYYENGTGVDKDEAKAIELHVNAAGLGNSISAQRLGHCYEDGECGVAVDKKEALKWCRVTVELGYTYAQCKVDRLEAELAATHTN
eukprot:31412-Pelagococcus_subviridis.AAC.5